MKLTNEQILEIIDLYNNGLSCSKIATQFKVTTGTISKHLKRNGIEVINKQNRTKFNESIFDVIVRFLELIYNKSNIYLDRKFHRYQLFKNCRSSKELLELLQTKNGEGCDVNPVVIEETKESSTP